MGDNLGKQIESQSQNVQRDYNMIHTLKNQFLKKFNIKNQGVINQIQGKGLGGVPGATAAKKPAAGVPGAKNSKKGVKGGKKADKDITAMEKTVSAEPRKATDKFGADIKKSEKGLAKSVKNVFKGKKGFAKTVNDLV